jgi:hypothetical protein
MRLWRYEVDELAMHLIARAFEVAGYWVAEADAVYTTCRPSIAEDIVGDGAAQLMTVVEDGKLCARRADQQHAMWRYAMDDAALSLIAEAFEGAGYWVIEGSAELHTTCRPSVAQEIVAPITADLLAAIRDGLFLERRPGREAQASSMAERPLRSGVVLEAFTAEGEYVCQEAYATGDW